MSPTSVGARGGRSSVAPLLVLVLLAVAGCSTSATPLVQRLAEAPVPQGAVLVAGEQADGNFELGPSASLDYSLTAPLAEACSQTLSLYAEAGYALTDWVDAPDVITDPESWCAQELQPADGISVPNVIAIAYPPDVESRYSIDGIVLTLIAGRDGQRNPGGTVLRMSAG